MECQHPNFRWTKERDREVCGRGVQVRILEGQGGEDIDDGDLTPALMIYIPLTDIIDTWTCALRLPEVFVDDIRTNS
jgi:hypothetical protein